MKSTKSVRRFLIVLFSMFVFFMMSITADAAFTYSKKGVNYPKTITEGASFTMKGTVTANSNIKKAVFTIYNSNGKKCLQRYEKTVNAKTLNINDADSYLHFEKLTAGKYYYRICIYTNKGTKVRIISKKFTVKAVSTGLKVTKTKVMVPTTLKVGKDFTMSGKLTANQKMKSVVLTIYDSTGSKRLQKYQKTINSKTYDISKANAKLDFSKLTVGTYYYRISVYSTANKKLRVVDAKFTVKEASSITIENAKPSSSFSMQKGHVYALSGTISSDYLLTAVQASILDSNNKVIYNKAVNPNAKTYSISGGVLDYEMHFEKLDKGTYTFALTARDANPDSSAVVVLIKQKFTVVDNTSSSISITNPVPVSDTAIDKGSALTLGGIIHSYYPLKEVSASVRNIYTGAIVLQKTVQCSSTNYAIAGSAIDQAMAFHKLPVGKYRFELYATDSKDQVRIVNSFQITVINN